MPPFRKLRGRRSSGELELLELGERRSAVQEPLRRSVIIVARG